MQDDVAVIRSVVELSVDGVVRFILVNGDATSTGVQIIHSWALSETRSPVVYADFTFSNFVSHGETFDATVNSARFYDPKTVNEFTDAFEEFPEDFNSDELEFLNTGYPAAPPLVSDEEFRVSGRFITDKSAVETLLSAYN